MRSQRSSRATPRQATPRDPEARTDGGAARFVAAQCGRTMPAWAVDLANVAGELDDAGRYRYGTVVVTVPRQSAKTTTALDVAIGRAVAHRDYRAAYAAQTGHVTTERFGDRFTELESGPLGSRLKLRRSQGTERITYRKQGSYVRAFPPIDGALRSSALDLVIVDEGQEHDDLTLGTALDATIRPTFTTRPRRQLWVVGTAPAARGTYLERYYRLAQAGAPGVALVDFGALPDEDVESPDVWRLRHPGLAAGLTDEEFLRSELDAAAAAGDVDRFAREYLNRWGAGAPGTAVDADRWRAARVDRPRPAAVDLAIDVAPMGAYAAVVAAWEVGPGRWHGAVVQAADGTSWVDAALADLDARLEVRSCVWDSVSQAAGLLGKLRADSRSASSSLLGRSTSRGLDFAEVSAATSWILDQIDGGALTVTPDADLDAAAAAGVLRRVGDAQRPAWGRRKSGATIAPLVALTLAAWQASTTPVGPYIA